METQIYQHYLTMPLKKMGRWALLPADVETWMTEHTSHYFQELFGLPKGILNISTLHDGYMQNYVPTPFINKLYAKIDSLTHNDPQGLEKILRTFYGIRRQACQQVAINKTDSRLSKISTEELINLYKTNRDWVHHISAFDQFGWIGENYWEPKMKDVLVKAGLNPGSTEYHQALFALAKPEELSTTLMERKGLLSSAIKIKQGKLDLSSAAKKLTKQFGWMPVFTYGTPWDASWYEKQLARLAKKEEIVLSRDYQNLVDYKSIRHKEISRIVKAYKLTERDQQVFMDFGLTLDVRNEAEYFVSFAGLYLIPLYQEMAKRLSLSVDELRQLFEDEIVSALRGEIDPKQTIKGKQGIVAWGFDPDMRQRFNLTGEAAKDLFEGVEKNLNQAPQSKEARGVCASPGQASGPARVLLTPAENDRVQEGDILVTVATTVDYLPAMQRASAIVTEVGGLTCHAAVVAREFGVPCIVSFANATRVFKDGQLLALNADKTTIKKIGL
ncbi:MAG: PEP-utilizing enzyme [Patescibacteria group bacterium]|nr:PEP-utilizing enzyme [Patescibacteria group bacterium]